MFASFRHCLYYLFKYRFYKQNVVENPQLAKVNFLFCFLLWFLIISWVLTNKGFINVNNQFQSSNVLKIIYSDAIETNFSKDQFKEYVKPEEYVNYNRIWDADDYSVIYPDEAHVITNLVITSNQTMSRCPLNDQIWGYCNETHNYFHGPLCFKGLKTFNGITTGRCVPSDFTSNVGSCEIRGILFRLKILKLCFNLFN